MADVVFREVRDGEMMPDREDEPDAVYWPRVLRWFCPSLTEAEAVRAAELGRYQVVSKANIMRLCLAVLSERAEPPSEDIAVVYAHLYQP